MQNICFRSNDDYFFYNEKDEKEMKNHLKLLAAFSSFSYFSGCGVIGACGFNLYYPKD